MAISHSFITNKNKTTEVDTIAPEYTDQFERTRGSDSMSDYIVISDFNISFGSKRLYTNASLRLESKKKYPLVGINGVGKSALLRYIYHRLDKFVEIPKHFNILYVEQEVNASDDSVLNFVINSDKLRLQLLEAERDLLDSAKFDAVRYDLIQNKLEAIDAYSAESRAAIILRGLQFSVDDQPR